MEQNTTVLAKSQEIVYQERSTVVKNDCGQKAVAYLEAMGQTLNLLPHERTLFVNIAREFGLNPFKREIYCVAYGDGKYRKLSIITGYDVYIKRAEASGKMNGWSVRTEGDGKYLKAVLTVHRKDWENPFEHEVYYEEAVQLKDGKPTQVWQKQPRFMTKKVAIGQGFRLCFPDTMGGMPYMADELAIEEDAPAPSGAALAADAARDYTAEADREEARGFIRGTPADDEGNGNSPVSSPVVSLPAKLTGNGKRQALLLEIAEIVNAKYNGSPLFSDDELSDFRERCRGLNQNLEDLKAEVRAACSYRMARVKYSPSKVGADFEASGKDKAAGERAEDLPYEEELDLF